MSHHHYHRSLHLLSRLGKIGLVGAGVAASIYATAETVKAANATGPGSGMRHDQVDGAGVTVAAPSTNNPTVKATGPGIRYDNLDDLRINVPGRDYPPFRKWNVNWDRLEPGLKGGLWPIPVNEEGNCEGKFCEKHETNTVPTARRNILLIRHGQFHINIDDPEDDGKQTLTDLGQEQAALVGQRLNSMGVKFTSIVSSTMTRAMQTACIILKQMEPTDLKLKVTDPLLREGPPCVPEPPYRKPELWNPNQRDVLVEGARIEAGFRKYFHRADPSQKEDSWEIIVCHGNVIRYFTCRALQFPPEGWIRMSIDHCSITRFVILPTGEVVIRGLGDSGHLPVDKISIT